MKNFAIVLLIFSLYFHSYISAYHIVGNTIYDLEETSLSGLTTEAIDWIVTGGLNGATKISSCWEYYLLGGYNVLTNPQGYFTRTYSGLPAHNTIYFSVRVFQIDSCDYAENDHFALGFDTLTISLWSIRRLGIWPQPSCGGSWTENPPFMVYVTLPHTANSLPFHFYSKFNQNSNDESVGFRDIALTTANLATPPTNISYCGVTTGFPLDDNWGPCRTDQYM